MNDYLGKCEDVSWFVKLCYSSLVVREVSAPYVGCYLQWLVINIMDIEAVDRKIVLLRFVDPNNITDPHTTHS